MRETRCTWGCRIAFFFLLWLDAQAAHLLRGHAPLKRKCQNDIDDKLDYIRSKLRNLKNTSDADRPALGDLAENKATEKAYMGDGSREEPTWPSARRSKREQDSRGGPSLLHGLPRSKLGDFIAYFCRANPSLYSHMVESYRAEASSEYAERHMLRGDEGDRTESDQDPEGHSRYKHGGADGRHLRDRDRSYHERRGARRRGSRKRASEINFYDLKPEDRGPETVEELMSEMGEHPKEVLRKRP